MTKGSQEFFKQTVAGADSIESRAEAYKSVIPFNETVKHLASTWKCSKCQVVLCPRFHAILISTTHRTSLLLRILNVCHKVIRRSVFWICLCVFDFKLSLIILLLLFISFLSLLCFLVISNHDPKLMLQRRLQHKTDPFTVVCLVAWALN